MLALFTALALSGVVWSIALVIPLLVSLYEAFPDSWHKWVRANFFFYSSGLTLIFALVFLGLWLIVNLIGPSRHDLRYIRRVGDSGVGQHVEINYPATVLADSGSATVTLALVNGLLLSDTLGVTVTWSSGLIYAAVPEQRVFTHTFELSRTAAATLPLQNAHTLATGSSQFLTVTVASTQGNMQTAMPLAVESEQEFALRSFVNSTVNQNSPLIILVAGLLSGAGALYAQYRQGEKDREEKEKRESDKKKADALVERFRAALLAENLADAETALKELGGLKEYVLDRLPIAEGLIKLARGEAAGELKSLVLATREWAAECVISFIMAHPRLLEKHPDALREARVYLPSQVKLPELWNRMEALQEEANVQPNDWPGHVTIPTPVVFRESCLFLDAVLEGKDPFAFERAEDEEHFLFERKTGAFWSGHDLRIELSITRSPHVTYGAEGCGRTAFALALGHYFVGRDHLSLYLSGQPTLAEIQARFAQMLLDFAKGYPTLLSRLSAAERTLLARHCVAVLGRDYARAEVKAAQSNLVATAWLGKAKDKSQRESWKRLATHQLLLLEQEIARTRRVSQKPERWPRELTRCALSLGFARATLILDITENGLEWANASILPHLRRWRGEGLLAHIFAPDRIFSGMKIDDGVTAHKRLKWTAEQLATLVRWRYQALAPGRTTIDGVFAAGQFDNLIAHSSLGSGELTPRRFAQLWNRIVYAMPPGKTVIDGGDIRRALEATS